MTDSMNTQGLRFQTRWLPASAATLGAALALLACSGSGSGDGSGGTANNSGGTASGSGGGSSSSGGAAGLGEPQSPPVVSGCAIFTAESAWNRDVSMLPVLANSDAMIDAIGRSDSAHPDFGTEWEGAPIGIPFVVVEGVAKTPINFVAYGAESDPGPYPIPLDAPIEGGPSSDGDRHVLALDTSDCKLYELYRGFPGASSWDADSGAIYDLSIDDHHPEGCTSADAAGLPIFPGLVRYDEVVIEKELRHAIRFTVENSRRAYLPPATHYASDSTEPSLPAMGQRFRMKKDFDCSSFSEESKVLCTAMKKYGLILADNGSNWYLSGAPDSRWLDENLNDIKSLTGDAFEAVDIGVAPTTDAPDCVIP